MDTKKLKQRQLALEMRFKEMERYSEDLMTDRGCMTLPHPARVKAIPMTHPDFMPAYVVGLEYEDLLIKLMKEGLCTRDMWSVLAESGSNKFMNFLRHNNSSQRIDGGFNGGSSGAIFQTMRFHLSNGVMFTIDDELLDMLENTDIDLDIPLSDVKLPYPNVYIELGRRREGADGAAKRQMHNDISGLHVLEGAYVSMTKRSAQAGGGSVMEVTMTGSPLGKLNAGDDAVEWVSMECLPQQTISASLHRAYISAGVLYGDPNEANVEFEIEQSEKLSELEKRSALRLELVIKALLYIGMPNLRKEFKKDRTQAELVVNRTKSTSHKRKAVRQAVRAYDTVLILPPLASTESGELGGHGRSVSAHWRRGHFRTQRHGEGLSLRKTIWLAPVLVNADALSGTVETPKYEVSR